MEISNIFANGTTNKEDIRKTVGQFARLYIYHQPQRYDSFSFPPKE